MSNKRKSIVMIPRIHDSSILSEEVDEIEDDYFRHEDENETTGHKYGVEEERMDIDDNWEIVIKFDRKINPICNL